MLQQALPAQTFSYSYCDSGKPKAVIKPDPSGKKGNLKSWDEQQRVTFNGTFSNTDNLQSLFAK